MPETRESNVEARRRKLWMVAKHEIGLTQDERIELTQYILRRDITSWMGLTDEQVIRLLDALEGYQLISCLLAMRPGALQPDRDTVPPR